MVFVPPSFRPPQRKVSHFIAGIHEFEFFKYGGYDVSHYQFRLIGLSHVVPTHSHNGGDTWVTDANNHWHVCTGEGCPIPEADAGVYDKAAHVWDDGEITKPATCLETGAKKYTCTVCGQTKVETIAALEHDFTDVSTKVNHDGMNVKLSTCSVGNEKMIRMNASDFSKAFTTSNSNAEGEPEAFAIGDELAKRPSSLKLDKKVAIAYKISVSAPIENAKLYIGAQMSSGHEGRAFYNMAIAGDETNTQSPDATTEDGYRYYAKVNDSAFEPVNPATNYGAVLKAGEIKYLPLGTFNLAAGDNLIYVRQGNIGYRLTFAGEFRIAFEGEATITGEEPAHEHAWGAAQAAIGDAIPHGCSGCDVTCYELAMANPEKLKSDVSWNITGLPAGTYEVQLYACIKAGTNRSQSILSDGVGRYQFKADGEYVNPGDKTYEGHGFGAGEDAAHCEWTKPLCQVTVGASATTFTIHWTDKGYSAYIHDVRLVPVA